MAHDRFRVVRQFLRNARSVEFVGFFLARREHRVESVAEIIRSGNAFGALRVSWRMRSLPTIPELSLHAAERFHVREPQFQRDALAGSQIHRIERGHLRAHLLRIYGRLVALNHVSVKRVLYIRTILAREQPLHDSFRFP